MSTWFDELYYLFTKIDQLRAVGELDANGNEYTLATVKKAIADAGMTPESHYVMYGRSEGLNPNPYFNEAEYLLAKTAQVNSIAQDGRTDWTVAQVEAAMADIGLTPADHYAVYGAFETDADGFLINPSNAFDANAYMAAKLTELVKIGYVLPNGTSVMEMTAGDLIGIFQKANLTPTDHYTMYGAQEANASGIAFVQTVPVPQRVKNDMFREALGEVVPTNYNAPSAAPGDVSAADATPVIKPADVGGLVSIHISPTVEHPVKNVPVPGDLGYVAPPCNVVDTNKNPVVIVQDDTGDVQYGIVANDGKTVNGIDSFGKPTTQPIGEVSDSGVITPANEQPTIGDATNSLAEDTVAAITGDVLTDNHTLGDGTFAQHSFAWDADQNGSYGTVTCNTDGTYSYTLDNSNPAVQALGEGHSLTETFTYSFTDKNGDADTGTLTITINGTDDEEPDSGTVTPANKQPTIGDATNSLAEDTVAAITGDVVTDNLRLGDGTLAQHSFAWDADQNGSYGEVTLNADGTYSYTLDNSNAAVQALGEGHSLTETFTYSFTDKDGDADTGTLTITINGTDDQPTIGDATSTVDKESTTAITGNVVTDNVSLGDGTFAQHRFAWDADQNGSYGEVKLNADGTYRYTLDNSNAAVQALGKGHRLTETFTYSFTDKDGDADTKTLTITINGTGVRRTYTNITENEGTAHLQRLDPTAEQTFTVSGTVSASLVGNASSMESLRAVSSTAADEFRIQNMTQNGSIIGDVTTINISKGTLTLGADTISVQDIDAGGIIGDSDSVAVIAPQVSSDANPVVTFGKDTIKVEKMGDDHGTSDTPSIWGDAREVTFNASGEVKCGDDGITVTSLLKGKIYGDAQTVNPNTSMDITFGDDIISIPEANTSVGFTIYGDAGEVKDGGGTVVFGADTITLDKVTSDKGEKIIFIYGDAMCSFNDAGVTVTGGDDTITVNGMDASFLSINGGYGADTISVHVTSPGKEVTLTGGPDFVKDTYTLTVDNFSEGGTSVEFIITDFDSKDTVTLRGATLNAGAAPHLSFSDDRDLQITYNNATVMLMGVGVMPDSAGADSAEIFNRLVAYGQLIGFIDDSV